MPAQFSVDASIKGAERVTFAYFSAVTAYICTVDVPPEEHCLRLTAAAQKQVWPGIILNHPNGHTCFSFRDTFFDLNVSYALKH